MGYAILAMDGPDPTRRAAAMERHLEVIMRWVAEGHVRFAVPLLGPDDAHRGSLILLDAPDRAGVDAYLAEEPFATDHVWADIAVHPFRIAPLPYRPLPRPGEPLATARTHTAIVAWDGTDPEAPARRLAVREAHMARVRPQAASGMLAVGGALLDEAGGTMRGSIAVIAQPSDQAARDWIADDPYLTGGVWRDIALHGTRLHPGPFQQLPGVA